MDQTQRLAHDPHIGGRIISPLPVHDWPNWAAGPEALAACGREADMAVARLVRAGNPAGMVTRFLASVHDGLYAGAARDAEAALGPPPCPYALLVLGSGARQESTLGTDQDHALVLAGDAPPGAGDWFAALPNGWRPPWSAVASPAAPGR